MGSRYTKLYTLDANLYSDKLPVVIVAGALSKDNLKDSVFVQLKIRNICSKHIKALKVKIYPRDSANRNLSEEIDFQYLDLDIVRNQEWGQKVAIYLPDNSTRFFSVKIVEIVFTDNSIWEDNDAKYESLSQPELLGTFFKDSELLKQYMLKIGNDSQYVVQEIKGLWRCTCGNLNWKEEASCYSCHKSFDNLKKAFDIERLNGEKEFRLRKERELAEEKRIHAEKKAEEERIFAEKRAEEERILAEKAYVEKEEKKKKNKKIFGIVATLMIIVAGVYLFLTMYYIPKQTYEMAIRNMNEGNYEEAIAIFSGLAGYDDALVAEKLLEAKYSNAIEKWEGGHYREAYEMLLELGEMGKIYDLIDGDISVLIQCVDEGDSIKFGVYEQDNILENGKEDVEWIVVERQDDKICLVSRYVLDEKSYDKEDRNSKWENCALYSWLNEEFIETAFSTEEKKYIVDKVQLLSVDSVERYFPLEEERIAFATEYAIEQGLYIVNDRDKASSYWLIDRYKNYHIRTITKNGSFNMQGDAAVGVGVRPVIWLMDDNTKK